MDVFTLTSYEGRVSWLGAVASRRKGLRSASSEALQLRFEGAEGEAHSGATRPACVRVKNLYPRDTPIANTRQLTVLGAEEMALIAAEMGLDSLDPAYLGASMVIEGLPDFTHLPPSSRLQFAGGATIVVDVENLPCVLPAKVIEKEHEGFGKLFKPAARSRRGITAWVEREGLVQLGDSVRLFVPSQRAWNP